MINDQLHRSPTTTTTSNPPGAKPNPSPGPAPSSPHQQSHPAANPKEFNVQGWLLYPANYDPAKKYPLIVYVHGGPSSATLPHWPGVGYGPVPFAALGYFVLMPNPRGSYGQGEAFTQANRKDFGYGDLRDILAGVDAVTRSHNIDPERVGLTGWSYGGFMTMFAVTQTNRFRAAVAGAGISNWQSYYGENSIDQWMIPFFGASVYDDPGVYAKMSAINFIHSVKTPTLAVVGDRDGECPAPQSFEFWHALKAQHVPTQLVVYPNEGHWLRRPRTPARRHRPSPRVVPEIHAGKLNKCGCPRFAKLTWVSQGEETYVPSNHNCPFALNKHPARARHEFLTPNLGPRPALRQHLAHHQRNSLPQLRKHLHLPPQRHAARDLLRRNLPYRHLESRPQEPGTLEVTEDGRLAFTATILSLTSHDLRLRQTLAFGNHEVREVTLTAIDKEFVCPDMPK